MGTKSRQKAPKATSQPRPSCMDSDPAITMLKDGMRPGSLRLAPSWISERLMKTEARKTVATS